MSHSEFVQQQTDRQSSRFDSSLMTIASRRAWPPAQHPPSDDDDFAAVLPLRGREIMFKHPHLKEKSRGLIPHGNLS